MAELEIKDVSRCYTSYDQDGSGVEDWVEEYIVLHKGYEVQRFSSIIKAERFVARLNAAHRLGSAVRDARLARRDRKVA